ncbi:MAG: hypothetical protein JW765_13670 [Deltaproteobacteria bacterium]|nr:hypothetical protein [Candidatus Zymogenaceae bacterium]
MALGTVGIMEKAYKGSNVKEIVDFKEVYSNSSFVFYYYSGHENDIQKRLAIVVYGISKDTRLGNIKLFGCDIVKRPVFKRGNGAFVDAGPEISGHGTISYPCAAIFDASNKPVDMFRVGPGSDESITNFLTVIPEWILSNLDKPLPDEKGTYIWKFDGDQTKIEKVYLEK